MQIYLYKVSKYVYAQNDSGDDGKRRVKFKLSDRHGKHETWLVCWLAGRQAGKQAIWVVCFHLNMRFSPGKREHLWLLISFVTARIRIFELIFFKGYIDICRFFINKSETTIFYKGYFWRTFFSKRNIF